jgi:hypothetical protein
MNNPQLSAVSMNGPQPFPALDQSTHCLHYGWYNGTRPDDMLHAIEAVTTKTFSGEEIVVRDGGDTCLGASGAPVFDSVGRLVAVHYASSDDAAFHVPFTTVWNHLDFLKDKISVDVKDYEDLMRFSSNSRGLEHLRQLYNACACLNRIRTQIQSIQYFSTMEIRETRYMMYLHRIIAFFQSYFR